MRYRRCYSEREIDETFSDGFRLPGNFCWGVGNSAYQTEGGLNGPGEPLNNWAPWERSGRAVPTGGATGFYERYGEDFENARRMSMSHFRMGLEWARIQPHPETEAASPPEFDPGALEHYAGMIAAVREAGLEPVVTLHHFTHPMWMGADMWLERDNLELFERYIRHAVTRINELLVERHGQRPIAFWESTNEPNIVSAASYILGRFPARRGLGPSRYLEALNNQLLAHVIAYENVHDIYRERGWGEPHVTLATVSLCFYWLDKVILDLMLARLHGVSREGLSAWLGHRADAFHGAVESIPRPSGPKFLAGRYIEKALSAGFGRYFKVERFDRLVERLYSSEFERHLDFMAIDFYDPFVGHYWKPPSLEEVTRLRPEFNIHHWQWVQNPPAFRAFLNAYGSQDDIPVHVFENGLCNRVKGGRAVPRADGMDRPAYLKAFLFELARAVKDGADVEGYFHWSITDNYEWGSYEPRFGLHGIDYEHGATRSTYDSMGMDAAGAYRRIVEALTNGSVKELKKALL